MNIKTHDKAIPSLLGTPIVVETGKRAKVELRTIKEMSVDDRGLIHGGFTYGLADYAAMLAVNHQFVVLGSSHSRFLAPVKVGDMMIALANVEKKNGRRCNVNVEVHVNNKMVFTGIFICFILEEHVLG